jgi:hypothetical protein
MSDEAAYSLAFLFFLGAAICAVIVWRSDLNER